MPRCRSKRDQSPACRPCQLWRRQEAVRLPWCRLPRQSRMLRRLPRPRLCSWQSRVLSYPPPAHIKISGILCRTHHRAPGEQHWQLEKHLQERRLANDENKGIHDGIFLTNVQAHSRPRLCSGDLHSRFVKARCKAGKGLHRTWYEKAIEPEGTERLHTVSPA